MEYIMSNSSQRFSDAVGVASTNTPSLLHSIFQSRGPPCSLAQSFSTILVSRQRYNQLDQSSLLNVQEISLEFARELLLRADRNSMKAEVKASVNSLTTDEAAAVCAYTLENGPYTVLNRVLRDENMPLLDPFVDYLWLLMHGLSKCPRPIVPLVYRGVRSGVGAYKVGDVITWCSFSSCTTQAEALENDMFLGMSGARTEFHITLTTNRARSIRHLSLMAEEEEILLPPNTRLRVMGRADRGHGLWVVQLLEEPCLAPILVFPGEYGTILDVEPHHRCSYIL
jgi:hypothetical protein